MGNKWYEVKVRYSKTVESGADKVVTEVYLMDALSFTEAEAKATEKLEPFMTGVFDLSAVAKKNYAEVHLNGTDGYYFLSTVELTHMDEKSFTEKTTKMRMIVEAADVQSALDITTEKMDDSIMDYRIVGVVETNILDVFLYQEAAMEF